MEFFDGFAWAVPKAFRDAQNHIVSMSIILITPQSELREAFAPADRA